MTQNGAKTVDSAAFRVRVAMPSGIDAALKSLKVDANLPAPTKVNYNGFEPEKKKKIEAGHMHQGRRSKIIQLFAMYCCNNMHIIRIIVHKWSTM